MPETSKRPLEEMNYLFTNAPLFVPTMDKKIYEEHDIERRVEEAERKGSVGSVGLQRDEKLNESVEYRV